MKASEANYIWNLLPIWVKIQEEGLDPTMYGTGTYEGDTDVSNKVTEILTPQPNKDD